MKTGQKLIICLSLILFIRSPLLAQDIHRAASQGDLEAVKTLLRSNPELVNRKDDSRGWTAIGLAAFNTHKAIVEFLIEHGADVNVKDTILWTPLHTAIRGGDTEIIELLIKSGAKVNSPFIEISPAIALDESCLLFVSSQPGGYFRTSDFSLEIFVSFQTEDGFWTKAKNIGRAINVLSPTSVSLSPDGKYFFFYSRKEKELFWASTELIDQLK